MQQLKVILLCILAAVVYGVVHDQITARVCVEYFTLAHPPIFHTTSPTLLGLGWGIAATWWGGLILGMLLAQASQSPPAPPVPISELCRPILGLLAVMALTAALAGCVGYILVSREMISLPGGWQEVIEPARQPRFGAVWLAHLTSYLVGFAGGGYVIYRIWRARGKPSLFTILPQTKAGWLRTVGILLVASLALWLRFGIGGR